MCTRCRFRKRFLLFVTFSGSWTNTKRMQKRYRVHVGFTQSLCYPPYNNRPQFNNHAIILLPLFLFLERCGNEQCNYGETCKVVLGVSRCECDFTCSDSKAPVCGSDSQNYDNECKMNEAACNLKKRIYLHANGKCG